MADKPPLPDGWIARRSRSYPDRVYYFNINTGESSWEFPDIIQIEQVFHKPPTTPQSKTSTNPPSDHVTNNKRKLSTPTHVQSPTEKHHHISTLNKTDGVKEPAQKKAKISPEKHPYSSTSNNTDRVKEPEQKKAKFSPIKFPSSSSTTKSGIVNNRDVIPKSSETDMVSRNLKSAFDGSAKNKVSNLQGQHDLNKKNLVPDTKLSNKISLSNKTKHNVFSGAKNGTVKVSKTFLKSSDSDTKPGISRLKLPESVTRTLNGKLDTKNAVNKNKINSSQSQLAKPDDFRRHSSSVKTKNDVKCDKSKVVDNKVQKDGITIDLTGGSDSSDKRKVVKSLQQELKRTERVVAANGKQLTVKTATNDNSKQPVENVITLDRPLFNLGNESPVSLADSDNEVKLKNFIGNKDKLLSIQSWIDNIQDGSDSPRKEFYGLQSVSQESGTTTSDIIDSGFKSPSLKPERGWPGAVKTSMVSSRQLVDMEVETWHLPEVDTSRVEEAMEVDINEVISQVRQIIKGETSSGQNLTDDNWEPKSSDLPLPQGVVLVVDTNIFLTNLNLVETLKEQNIPDFGRPTLFIPWIVLRELDYIKSSSESKHKSVQTKAKKAIWLMKSLIRQKQTNIRGQTPRQFDEAAKQFKADCNDDCVLQACLQCKLLYDGCEVILLSNDNNLIVKSSVVGVPAYTSHEIHDGLKNLKPKLIQETNNNIKICSSHLSNNQTVSVQRSSVHSDSYVNFTDQTVSTQRSSVPSDYHTHIANQTASAKRLSIPSDSYTNFTDQTVSAQRLSVPGDSHTYVVNQTVSAQRSSVPSDFHANVIQHSPQLNKHSDGNLVYTPFCQQPGSSLSNTYPNGAMSKYNYSSIPLPHPSQPHCMADNLLQEEQSYTMDNLVEDVHSKLLNLLKEGFGKVLEEELKLAYDDIWLQVVFKKPPWSLIDILECWKKHWISTLGMVFRRTLISNVEKLLCAFHSKITPSLQTVCEIAKESLEILQECVRRNKYGETMIGIKECVLCIYELCEDLIHNNITIQSISSLSDYLKSKLVPEKCNNSINSSQNSVHSDGLSSRHVPQSSRNPQHVQPIIQSPGLQRQSQIIPQSPGLQQQSQIILHSPVIQPQAQIVPHSPAVQPPLQIIPHSPGVQPPLQIVQVDAVHMGIATAGELLEQIWHYLFTSCHRISQAISIQNTGDAQKLLTEIVPVAKDLRIMYVGLLEIPVPELSVHERDFTLFTDFANSFLKRCQEQDIFGKSKVTPVFFLMLFSDLAHRQTLMRLQVQLDDMLRHLYQCLHVVFPD